MGIGNDPADWPALPYLAWKETCDALHLQCQIVGKYRLAHTPWVNHSWHATLYVTPRGLTTGPIPDGPTLVTVSFDFVDHMLNVETKTQRVAMPLRAMSTAAFLNEITALVTRVGGRFNINGMPNEVPDPIPFAKDIAPRPYDRDAVARFHSVIVSVDRVFAAFRTSFLGKVSPVHLFWGSFDLAVTRFSGKAAPLHPGGVPGLPDAVSREAYSHEVSSAGFWPGGSGVEEPMFYSYAYPAPDGFPAAKVDPDSAYFDRTLGEFLLPYEAVRSSASPEATLLRFLTSTYDAAANLAHWDRAHLECGIGQPRIPRPVAARAGAGKRGDQG